jgi:DNA-binding NarL/FixJ family response regulator
LSDNGDRIQVLVVDDHEIFRTGLAELLESEDLNVVGIAGDGTTALEMVEQTAPDVVLMDLEMPGLSGVETIRRMAVGAPRTRVVVLTVSAEEQSVVDAISAGACGYLLKGTSLESLVAGVKAAVEGEALMSAAVAGKLFERIRLEAPPNGLEGPSFRELSEREVEILKLIAAGKRNSEIAEILFISPHTVRNHISNILAKLQIHNRIEAAAWAIKNRMV